MIPAFLIPFKKYIIGAVIAIGFITFVYFEHKSAVEAMKKEVAEKAVSDYKKSIEQQVAEKVEEDKKESEEVKVVYKDRIKVVTKVVKEIESKPTTTSTEINQKYNEVLKCFVDC